MVLCSKASIPRIQHRAQKVINIFNCYLILSNYPTILSHLIHLSYLIIQLSYLIIQLILSYPILSNPYCAFFSLQGDFNDMWNYDPGCDQKDSQLIVWNALLVQIEGFKKCSQLTEITPMEISPYNHGE